MQARCKNAFLVGVILALAFRLGTCKASNKSGLTSSADVERLLYRKNNAVLDRAGLGSEHTLTQVKDEEDSPYLASYTFVVDDFNARRELRLDSHIFRASATHWQLLLYPRGDEGQDGYVSLYLSATMAAHWTDREGVYAKWRFSVVNRNGRRGHVSYEAWHNFTRSSPTWGYTKLAPLSTVLDPEAGFVDDSGALMFRVDVSEVSAAWVDYTGIERSHYNTVQDSVSLWLELQGLGYRDIVVTYSVTHDGGSKIGFVYQDKYYESLLELRDNVAAQAAVLRDFFAGGPTVPEQHQQLRSHALDGGEMGFASKLLSGLIPVWAQPYTVQLGMLVQGVGLSMLALAGTMLALRATGIIRLDWLSASSESGYVLAAPKISSKPPAARSPKPEGGKPRSAKLAAIPAKRFAHARPYSPPPLPAATAWRTSGELPLLLTQLSLEGPSNAMAVSRASSSTGVAAGTRAKRKAADKGSIAVEANTDAAAGQSSLTGACADAKPGVAVTGAVIHATAVTASLLEVGLEAVSSVLPQPELVSVLGELESSASCSRTSGSVDKVLQGGNSGPRISAPASQLAACKLLGSAPHHDNGLGPIAPGDGLALVSSLSGDNLTSQTQLNSSNIAEGSRPSSSGKCQLTRQSQEGKGKGKAASAAAQVVEANSLAAGSSAAVSESRTPAATAGGSEVGNVGGNTMQAATSTSSECSKVSGSQPLSKSADARATAVAIVAASAAAGPACEQRPSLDGGAHGEAASGACETNASAAHTEKGDAMPSTSTAGERGGKQPVAKHSASGESLPPRPFHDAGAGPLDLSESADSGDEHVPASTLPNMPSQQAGSTQSPAVTPKPLAEPQPPAAEAAMALSSSPSTQLQEAMHTAASISMGMSVELVTLAAEPGMVALGSCVHAAKAGLRCARTNARNVKEVVLEVAAAWLVVSARALLGMALRLRPDPRSGMAQAAMRTMQDVDALRVRYKQDQQGQAAARQAPQDGIQQEQQGRGQQGRTQQSSAPQSAAGAAVVGKESQRPQRR